MFFIEFVCGWSGGLSEGSYSVYGDKLFRSLAGLNIFLIMYSSPITLIFLLIMYSLKTPLTLYKLISLTAFFRYCYNESKFRKKFQEKMQSLHYLNFSKQLLYINNKNENQERQNDLAMFVEGNKRITNLFGPIFILFY